MLPGGNGAPPPAGQKGGRSSEAAPEEEGKAADDAGPQAGYTNQHRRRTQVIELDGYFARAPSCYTIFNLGQGYVTTARKMAFRLSHAASSAPPSLAGARREPGRHQTCAAP